MWSLLAASPNLNYPQNLPRQSMRFRCLPPANCILSKNRKTAGLYRQAAFSAIVALIILHHDLISIWPLDLITRSESDLISTWLRSDHTIWSHDLISIWLRSDLTIWFDLISQSESDLISAWCVRHHLVPDFHSIRLYEGMRQYAVPLL